MMACQYPKTVHIRPWSIYSTLITLPSDASWKKEITVIKHSAKYSANYFQWYLNERYHKGVLFFFLILGRKLAVNTIINTMCFECWSWTSRFYIGRWCHGTPAPNCLQIVNSGVTGVRQICQRGLCFQYHESFFHGHSCRPDVLPSWGFEVLRGWHIFTAVCLEGPEACHECDEIDGSVSSQMWRKCD